MAFEVDTTLHHNSRKSHRVYRSPSSLNEPSPYAKANTDTAMDIDAKDEEAGSILMALSQHAARIRSNSTHDKQPIAASSMITGRSNSMSIRNLLDNETLADKPPIRPYQSVSTGYKPYYESRRKGFQICLAQRSTVSTDEDMYHHRRKQRSLGRHPTNQSCAKHYRPLKIKGNTAHIHISYRIHAHQASLFETARFKSTKTIQSSYPRASHSAPYTDHHHHYPYPYRQDV
ncbi:hypothetical protein BD408DRAFT_426443 [Parasitella parasitica]|nr:hypothetical protein BD408DRAFT_426443 [Parasitella parasitica]